MGHYGPQTHHENGVQGGAGVTGEPCAPQDADRGVEGEGQGEWQRGEWLHHQQQQQQWQQWQDDQPKDQQRQQEQHQHYEPQQQQHQYQQQNDQQHYQQQQEEQQQQWHAEWEHKEQQWLQQCPSLQGGSLGVGDIIAYRMLVLTDSWTPEFSSLRVREVWERERGRE